MANSLQHNWESVFFDTYNKIIEDNMVDCIINLNKK